MDRKTYDLMVQHGMTNPTRMKRPPPDQAEVSDKIRNDVGDLVTSGWYVILTIIVVVIMYAAGVLLAFWLETL